MVPNLRFIGLCDRGTLRRVKLCLTTPFSELNRTQGTGDNVNDTIISHGSEYLAILQGIDVDLIDEASFTPVDIA